MITDLLKPYLDTIVQALIGLLVALILSAIAVLRKKVEAWLDSRTSAQQREILHRLAGEAMALAETELKKQGGIAKMDAALKYVLSRAADYGIQVGIDTIRAAIEKAVLDYNAQTKGGGADANQKQQ